MTSVAATLSIGKLNSENHSLPLSPSLGLHCGWLNTHLPSTFYSLMIVFHSRRAMFPIFARVFFRFLYQILAFWHLYTDVEILEVSGTQLSIQIIQHIRWMYSIMSYLTRICSFSISNDSSQEHWNMNSTFSAWWGFFFWPSLF